MICLREFLQSLEAGRRWVGPRTIRFLAQELEVSQSELFRDCDAEENPDPVTLLKWFSQTLNLHLPKEIWKKIRIVEAAKS